MEQEEQQQQQQQNENLVLEHPHWIGGSIFVQNFRDNYEYDELINRGDFAEVYKCHLKNRKTIRAVKCLPKGNNRTTPIRNASLVLQLDHPNVVVLREILESPREIFIVQDFINGPNLFQKIGLLEVYTEHHVSKYTSEILNALRYMHERRIYHGKLHGENVLVRTIDNEEKLCLVDYAYTNLCPRDAIRILVNETASFCAPEILRGESFSASVDLWQLGILIFYCLSGTYPFHGTQKQIFQKILNGKVEYNPTEWDHISTNGKAFVADLLKVNVRDRLALNKAFVQPWIREKVYRSERLDDVQQKMLVHHPPSRMPTPPLPAVESVEHEKENSPENNNEEQNVETNEN